MNGPGLKARGGISAPGHKRFITALSISNSPDLLSACPANLSSHLSKYHKTAQRLAIGMEFKQPSLEDVMKFRKELKLKQQATTY
jgi:hypothetical protein